MATNSTSLILDMNIRCPDCGYDIPPNQLVVGEKLSARCPKCGHEWSRKAAVTAQG